MKRLHGVCGSSLVMLAVACGSNGGDDSGSNGSGNDGSGNDGSGIGDAPADWEAAGGASAGVGSPDDLSSASRDCKDGASGYELPGSGVQYCMKASPECEQAGAGCPLVVTVNTDGAFFSRVGEAGEDPVIVAELFGPRDGNDVKDQFAELPRVLSLAFPGLDKERVYAVGWSAGSGALTRGLCHVSKMSDASPYGSTSDVYAALVGLGGCGCSKDYEQIAGNYHQMTFNGTEDQFNGGDSCEEGLRERAKVNGCSNLGASWKAIEADDPYAENGTGSNKAERIHFGECDNGEVVGYRGKDEGHVLSFKKNFDPKISGYDTAWNFVMGKTK